MRILKEEFVPFLEQNGAMTETWFMQNGAPPHTADKSLKFLPRKFKGRIISMRYKDIFRCGLTWPAYSLNLNPCDYFLWSFVKNRVYKNEPKSIDELEEAIVQETNSISRETLARVFDSFERRVKDIENVQGGHIE